MNSSTTLYLGQRKTNVQQKSGRPVRSGGRRGQYAIEDDVEEESKSPFSALFGFARLTFLFSNFKSGLICQNHGDHILNIQN